MYKRYKVEYKYINGVKTSVFRSLPKLFSTATYSTLEECMNAGVNPPNPPKPGGDIWQSYPGRCDKLTCGSSFIYNECVTEVKHFGLESCLSLEKINLPNCTYLSHDVFQNCSSLQSVNLPECTFVSYYTFADCISLQSIDLPKCTFVNDSAFQNCSSLQRVNLPECSKVNYRVFQNCTSLVNISLPKCINVESYAFESCTSLSEIYLPACILINGNAFKDCSKLLKISLVGHFCSIRGGDAFVGTPIAKGTGSIYVPASLINRYKREYYWSEYASQIFPI